MVFRAITAWFFWLLTAAMMLQSCHVVLPLAAARSRDASPDAASPDAAPDNDAAPDALSRPDAGAHGAPDALLDLGKDAPQACRGATRSVITIDATRVGQTGNTGTLPASGFPVVVQLRGDWLKNRAVDPENGRVAEANGQDIFFTATDGVTRLPHEIEAYDGTQGTLTAWVRLDSLSLSTDTPLHLRCGNPCSDGGVPAAPGSVWDEHYRGVWHLTEDEVGTGAAGVYRDATPNANHCRDQVSATGLAAKQGLLALGQEFDGRDDFLNCGKDSSLNITGAITLSAWIRPRVVPDVNRYFMVLHKKWWSYQMFIHRNPDLTTTLGGYFRLVDASQALRTFDIRSRAEIDREIVVGTWTHVAITFDQRDLAFYVNGVLDYQIPFKGSILSAEPMSTAALGMP